MNYTDLKSLVAQYLDRTDLTTIIPTFIQITESIFNRKLRVGGMTVRATTSGVDDQIWYDLPEDWLGARSVKVNDKDMDYLSPEQVSDAQQVGVTGRSRYYTIEAQQYRMFPSPSDGDTIEITYYKEIPTLSDTNLTNWVITKHPDLYLYCTLAESERYLKNDERHLMWKGLYEEALSDLKLNDQKDRWSGGTMRIRAQ